MYYCFVFGQFAPTGCGSVLKAMQFISNPRETCDKMYAIMNRLLERIDELKDDPKCAGVILFSVFLLM